MIKESTIARRNYKQLNTESDSNQNQLSFFTKLFFCRGMGEKSDEKLKIFGKLPHVSWNENLSILSFLF